MMVTGFCLLVNATRNLSMVVGGRWRHPLQRNRLKEVGTNSRGLAFGYEPVERFVSARDNVARVEEHSEQVRVAVEDQREQHAVAAADVDRRLASGRNAAPA